MHSVHLLNAVASVLASYQQGTTKYPGSKHNSSLSPKAWRKRKLRNKAAKAARRRNRA